MKLTSFILLSALATGCSTSGQSTLGEDSTITPGWGRLKQATLEAIYDPNVWVPTLASTVLQINNYDEELADTLYEDNPLFGSPKDAMDASDDLLDLTEMAYISTAILTPGPTTVGSWLATKGKLLGAEYVTVEGTRSATTNLKHTFNRDRPRNGGPRGFPSEHASVTAAQGRMTTLNTNSMPINNTAKQVVNVSMHTLSGLTAWARVEAGAHYPADVLMGYALGNFMGHIATAFIMPEQDQIAIVPEVSNDSIVLNIAFKL